jgi:NADPH-dependent ferric siderophore reductase
LIPPAGISTPEWPLPGRNGRMQWPPEPRRPPSRVYTIRSLDVAAGTMDVDFVLHGDEGPASAWAARAAPGDIVGILGPVGRQIPEADWYLLACDETGIPAIARILEKLPAGARGHAFIEVADAAEEQVLPTSSSVEVMWLHRHGAAAGTTTLLQDSVRATPWPSEGRLFAWAGAEGTTARTLRSYWREDRGLDRSQHLAVAYWNRDSGAGDGMRGSKT